MASCVTLKVPVATQYEKRGAPVAALMLAKVLLA
jgi:hypothetical protein